MTLKVGCAFVDGLDIGVGRADVPCCGSESVSRSRVNAASGLIFCG